MNILDKTSDTTYVDKISDSLKGGKDKFEITKYLENQGGRVILEIGPGGGQVLEKLISLSEGWHRTDKYFVIDLDFGILHNLKGNPIVSRWKDYFPILADAMMLPFRDESFDMINLSAVGHECSTYSGGVKGFAELVTESSRVLKKSGVLVFRDLEGINLKRKCQCQFKTRFSNSFFKLFFKKFIDRKYASFKKPKFYDLSKISVYLDGVKYSIRDSFKDGTIFRYKSDTILEAPVGIVKEIQRHFITFINAYVPEYFYEVVRTLDDSEDIVLRFLKHGSVNEFTRFCEKSSITYYKISDFLYQIKKADKDIFDANIEQKIQKLQQNCLINVSNGNINTFKKILKNENIEINVKKNTFVLPIGEILYLDNIIKDVEAEVIIEDKILNWSRREGEEYYFYGDLTTMISSFIENSITIESSPDGTFSGLTLLAPIETKFVPRKKYISVLENNFQLIEDRSDCSFLEGKRVIHFQKFPIEIGFAKIIDFFYNSDECKYDKKINNVLVKIEKYIRDYISRSLEFNENFLELLSADPFISDTILIDDAIESLSNSKEIAAIEGSDIILVGRIGTKKESFKIYFKECGYKIINLTDILAKELSISRPTRKDLFFAGKEIREKFGADILAKKAVEIVRAEETKNYLILGCRSPAEIQYIKDCYPNIFVIGLFPNSDNLLSQLKKRHPDVDKNIFEKWIEWNDGMESDGYTNIKMCMQMCDLLFKDIK